MIALIQNKSGKDGWVRISLHMNKFRKEVEKARSQLEHFHIIKNEKDISVFILEANSLQDMLKTHGIWFEKLNDK